MDTIFIEGLVLSGRHGVGAPERAKHQRFSLDIHVKQHPAQWKEDILNTYNYMEAQEIARRYVEEQSFKLLETLSHSIINEIFKNPLAQSVTITIRKLDVIPPATVGVTLTRIR